MALIKCKECGKKVSNKAETCIECGYPLSKNKKNGSEEIKTLQKTKKSIKFQLLLSKPMIGIGGLMMILFSDSSSPVLKYVNSPMMYMYLGMCLLAIGTILYIVSKIRIWWNHD